MEDQDSKRARIKAQTSERKKRWRAANRERNQDHDLRARVNAAAKTIHGAHDSSEKTDWIAKEIIKRKQKREMNGSGVPGAKGGLGEFSIDHNMDEPNEFLGVDMDGNKQFADGARPEKPIVAFGLETPEADRNDPEIDIDLSIDEIEALRAMLREADQASQQQYTPEGVAATLEAPLNGCFMRYDDPEITQEAIRIPDITPFIPRGTDPDVAETLMEMYRLHCISLVECVRDMRLKQFHQLFFSFYGTLTVPVQKLLAAPSLALWIQEADWVMYKEIIRLLSPLALHVIPPSVLNALCQLSTDLPTHTAVMFSTCSHFLRQAKLASATIFSRLVDRLLRVNKAAHEAAQFLGNPPERQQMVQDWQAFVNLQMIVDRELPCHSPLLKDILESEISNLLQPGYYGATIESILEKWTVFLANLPERFGEISPKYFHIFLSAVASAALRDLTRNGAITGWSWWLLSCWIDEWMRWQAVSAEFLRKSVAVINNDHVPLLREEHYHHLIITIITSWRDYEWGDDTNGSSNVTYVNIQGF